MLRGIVLATVVVACGGRDADPKAGLACPSGTQQRGDSLNAWCELSSGLKHGPQRRWWEAGVKSHALNWQNGRKVGLYEHWWPNGKLAEKGTYIDGERHGLWKHWFDDGTLIRSGSYDGRGKKHGRWRGWDRVGLIVADEEYEHGDLTHSKLYKQGELWMVNGVEVGAVRDAGSPGVQ